MKHLIISAFFLSIGFNSFATNNSLPTGAAATVEGRGGVAEGGTENPNKPNSLPFFQGRVGEGSEGAKISISNLLNTPSGAAAVAGLGALPPTSVAATGCACKPIKGYEVAGFTNTTFQKCKGEWISIYSCDNVVGAVLNDDPATANRTEYDLTGATTMFKVSTDTRAIVDVGGSCFQNIDRIATVNWAVGIARTPRDRGICPQNWHVPSSCEFIYLHYKITGDPSSAATLSTVLGLQPSIYFTSDPFVAAQANGGSGQDILVNPYINATGMGWALGNPQTYLANAENIGDNVWLRCIHD